MCGSDLNAIVVVPSAYEESNSSAKICQGGDNATLSNFLNEMIYE